MPIIAATALGVVAAVVVAFSALLASVGVGSFIARNGERIDAIVTTASDRISPTWDAAAGRCLDDQHGGHGAHASWDYKTFISQEGIHFPLGYEVSIGYLLPLSFADWSSSQAMAEIEQHLAALERQPTINAIEATSRPDAREECKQFVVVIIRIIG